MTASNQPQSVAPRNVEIAGELTNPLSPTRTLFSIAMNVIAFTLAGLALLPLFSILFKILVEGLPHLSLEAFTSLPAPLGMDDVPNGFANAIQGTLIMVSLASVLSIPIGLATGIFLSEFSKGSALAGVIRFLVQVLSGVPSIVVGVFAYAVIVIPFRGFSAWAGAFALAVIMVPIISLTTEEALKLIPVNQRLGSAALGATRFQTIFKAVVAPAIPGITTGILLAISRAAGETAPLIFTALFSLNWAEGLSSPTPSLSVLIYNYASSAYKEQNELAWTASAVLVGLVLCANILSRVATSRRIQLR
jgi:phosphate transport system permease protein